MSAVYAATLKTNRMQLVADLIDSKVAAASTGAGSAGQLVIGTGALSGSTGVLATIALPNPPFTISGAVATLAGVPLSVAASASGTAALAELRNNAGITVVSGLTVGTSATDIILGTTTISSGGTVTITAGTITHG
jgi:sugar (pentulose or hexulose) kinase